MFVTSGVIGVTLAVQGLILPAVVRRARLPTDATDSEPVRRAEAHYTALRLELLAHKRATVVRLRDERRIDDTVLRQVQAKLDIEEARLSRREDVDWPVAWSAD